jgi:hypothetical protein
MDASGIAGLKLFFKNDCKYMNRNVIHGMVAMCFRLFVMFCFVCCFTIVAQDELSWEYLNSMPVYTSMEAALKDKANVKRLDLSNQALQSLPAEIGNFPELLELNISRNKLIVLPAEIKNLKNLRVLRANSNYLQRFPEEITQLSLLQILELYQNKIITIPPSIAALSNLRELELSDNKLTFLPAQIGSLTKVRVLRSVGNIITSIPAELSGMKDLQELDLRFNRIARIPASLATLPKLQKLFMYRNELKSVPEEFRSMRTLKIADLEFNRFTTVDSVRLNLDSIETIRLGFNLFNFREWSRLTDKIPAGKLEFDGLIPPPMFKVLDYQDTIRDLKASYSVPEINKYLANLYIPGQSPAQDSASLLPSYPVASVVEKDEKQHILVFLPMRGVLFSTQGIYPRWSPRGGALAYISGEDRQTDDSGRAVLQLYIIKTNGGDKKRISNIMQPLLDFSWSPGGKYIYYTVGGEYPQTYYEQPEITGSIETLPNSMGAVSVLPLAQPDLFAGIFLNRYEKIFQLKIFSSIKDSAIIVYEGNDAIEKLELAPDNNTLAFMRNTNGQRSLMLYSIAKNELRTVQGVSTEFISFSPDSKSILVSAKGQNNLINLADLSVQNLKFGTPALLYPQFSKDGNSIYFLDNQEDTFIMNNYDIATGKIIKILQSVQPMPFSVYAR